MDPYQRLKDLDSDPDPALFVSDLQNSNNKYYFLTKFFGLILFEDTFTSVFKDKKS